jgi:hypothetical protein
MYLLQYTPYHPVAHKFVYGKGVYYKGMLGGVLDLVQFTPRLWTLNPQRSTTTTKVCGALEIISPQLDSFGFRSNYDSGLPLSYSAWSGRTIDRTLP